MIDDALLGLKPSEAIKALVAEGYTKEQSCGILRNLLDTKFILGKNMRFKNHDTNS